jgi:hypothetical protein
MPPLNERSFRTGLTRWEIAPLAALAVIAVILFAPFVTAKGIGSHKISLHLIGPVSDEAQIRVALILRRHADFLLTEPAHPDGKWQTVQPEMDLIEDQVTVVTDTPCGILMCYRTTRYPYQDAVAVEYRTAGQPPRFRLIPFELGSPPATIEVDVPRNPPIDAEAWKPD